MGKSSVTINYFITDAEYCPFPAKHQRRADGVHEKYMSPQIPGTSENRRRCVSFPLSKGTC